MGVMIAVVAGAVVALMLGVVLIAKLNYRSVPPGRALVINRGRDRTVSFTGALVLPILQRADEIDLAVRQIEIHRRGKEGVICADNLRADLTVNFFIRVNRTVDDVLRVADSIGCERATDPRTLEELFTAKFSEAIKTVAKQLELEQLFTQRDVFKDQIIQVIGRDLNDYILDDAAIDYLEQTPLEHLDPSNVLDAQGIRKIRSLAVEPTSQPMRARDLYSEIGELGIRDIRVTTEISCEVSPERPAVILEIASDTELADLPASVTRGGWTWSDAASSPARTDARPCAGSKAKSLGRSSSPAQGSSTHFATASRRIADREGNERVLLDRLPAEIWRLAVTAGRSRQLQRRAT